MTEILLQTKNLHYADLLAYPDLTIESGRVTFIVGASGSGKSTLLKLFNAALPPSEGTVLYRGADIAAWDTVALRRELALVSQEVFLFSGDIRENFRQFYHYRRREQPTDQEIERFLELCCLPLSLDKATDTMSGGERQRLYIALFASFAPPVLMLDEPTAALDEATGRQVLSNLIADRQAAGQELVVVCHDPLLTAELAEAVVRIERGVS